MGRSNTALIVTLILFVLVAGGFGYGAYKAYDRVYRKPEAGGKKGLYYQLKEDDEPQHALLRREIREVRRQIVRREAQERRLRIALSTYQDDMARFSGNQKFARGGGDVHAAQVEEIKNTQTNIEKDKNEMLQALARILDENTKRHVAQLEAIDKEIRETQDRIRSAKEQAKVESSSVSERLAKLKRARDRLRAELEQYTAGARQELRLPLPTIGEVIEADPETSFAAIDLGERHGVKPGFRFQVVQIGRNNRRLHKGWLVVRTVKPEMSVCEIVTKTVRLPVCPITGYTAREPEERYSPMVTSPGEGQHYQRLNATPRHSSFAPAPENPIVKGNLLYNPLFRPGRTLRFVIAGQPIRYEREEIERRLAFYGATIEEELATTADFLIAQSGPKAMAEVQKAAELGVGVLYEWDLFRFLEH